MTDFTVTIAQKGTSIASNGTLTSIKMTKAPSIGGIYFTLSDTITGEQIFCCDMSSSFFPTGVVFPMYDHPYQDLTLENISTESEYILSTLP